MNQLISILVRAKSVIIEVFFTAVLSLISHNINEVFATVVVSTIP